MISKSEMTGKIKQTLSVAMSEYGFSVREIMNICGEVISDNVSCSSHREHLMEAALFESFNLHAIKEYSRFDVFSLAGAISVVFKRGKSTHSPQQKENYDKYKKGFLKMCESDQSFLIEKYPNLGILKED